MKHLLKIALSALVLILAFSGCGEKDGDKDTATVTLQIKAKYGDEAFALNSPNTDDQGRKLKFEKFSFFLSRIKLVKADNSEVELKDAAIVDFNNTGSLQIKMDVAEGDFTGLRIGLGVDSLQNAANKPINATEGSVWKGGEGSEMYWSWLRYIFQFVQGKYAAAGTDTYNSSLIYHIGSDALYRQISFTKNLSTVANADTKLTLTLDVEKVFNTAPAIDIATEAITESEGTKYPIAVKFANNFAQAFTLE